MAWSENKTTRKIKKYFVGGLTRHTATRVFKMFDTNVWTRQFLGAKRISKEAKGLIDLELKEQGFLHFFLNIIHEEKWKQLMDG